MHWQLEIIVNDAELILNERARGHGSGKFRPQGNLPIDICDQNKVTAPVPSCPIPVELLLDT